MTTIRRCHVAFMLLSPRKREPAGVDRAGQWVMITYADADPPLSRVDRRCRNGFAIRVRNAEAICAARGQAGVAACDRSSRRGPAIAPDLRGARSGRPLVRSGDPRASRRCPLRCGGATRAATVRGALDAFADAANDDWIVVHDAARPCVDRESLARLQRELADDDVGGLLAVPVVSALKRADDSGRVAAHNRVKGNGTRRPRKDVPIWCLARCADAAGRRSRRGLCTGETRHAAC